MLLATFHGILVRNPLSVLFRCRSCTSRAASSARMPAPRGPATAPPAPAAQLREHCREGGRAAAARGTPRVLQPTQKLKANMANPSFLPHLFHHFSAMNLPIPFMYHIILGIRRLNNTESVAFTICVGWRIPPSAWPPKCARVSAAILRAKRACIAAISTPGPIASSCKTTSQTMKLGTIKPSPSKPSNGTIKPSPLNRLMVPLNRHH